MAEPLTIREKVEKVIDEGEGVLRSVIVRMQSADEGREPTLRTAAYRMLQRSLSQSARDILPSEVEPAPKVAAKKEAEEERFGLSQLRGTSRQQQMAYGRRSIRPLLKCEPVSRHEQNPVRGAIAEFLTAKSVLRGSDRDRQRGAGNLRLSRERPVRVRRRCHGQRGPDRRLQRRAHPLPPPRNVNV